MKLLFWHSRKLGVVPLLALLLAAPAWALNITGTVFEDVNYGGGVGPALAGTTGYKPLANVRVELYDGSGNFVSNTLSITGGTYAVGGLANGTFTVRVVNSSVLSARTGSTALLIGVQTYRTDASSGSAVAVS
jgi:hypothetical protein